MQEGHFYRIFPEPFIDLNYLKEQSYLFKEIAAIVCASVVTGQMAAPLAQRLSLPDHCGEEEGEGSVWFTCWGYAPIYVAGALQRPTSSVPPPHSDSIQWWNSFFFSTNYWQRLKYVFLDQE